MKKVLVTIAAPFIGFIAYSISHLLTCICFGIDPTSTPSVLNFILYNLAAFVLMATWVKRFLSEYNTPFQIGAIAYMLLTIGGLQLDQSYGTHFTVIILVFGGLIVLSGADAVSFRN